MRVVAPLSAGLVLSFAAGNLAQQAGSAPYMNAALPTEQRVQDLVGRMTLDEKISEMINTSAAIPRLNVPAYDWWNEGLHGVARSGYATVFPQAIGMAATWNAPLFGKFSTATSTEVRAKYNEAVRHDVHSIYYGLSIWSPNINMFRDPRWGRGQETYGEDPFQTARLGVAFVNGLQPTDPKYLRVVATPKHFAVHSGPESTRHMPMSTPPGMIFGRRICRLPGDGYGGSCGIDHVRIQRARWCAGVREQGVAGRYPAQGLGVQGLCDFRLRRCR